MLVVLTCLRSSSQSRDRIGVGIPQLLRYDVNGRLLTGGGLCCVFNRQMPVATQCLAVVGATACLAGEMHLAAVEACVSAQMAQNGSG